jgi:uncharacterized membrane protein
MDGEKTKAADGRAVLNLLAGLLYDVLVNRRGRLIGAVVGLTFGFLLYRVGIFWTLVLTVTTGLGLYIGQRVDEQREDILDILDRVLPPR